MAEGDASLCGVPTSIVASNRSLTWCFHASIVGPNVVRELPRL